MKITKTQLAHELESPALFLRHYGRLMEVTTLATAMDEANSHMAANESEGLLAEYGGFCFMARLDDKGAASLTALTRALVLTLDEATPGELAEAARALDEMYVGFTRPASVRRIARVLAPAFHKLRK